MLERIQKILSARGIASRRKAEEYIMKGLVKVNGKVATRGQKADGLVDHIEVDGKVIAERKEMLYFLMNKPVGVETTNISQRGEIGSTRLPDGQGGSRRFRGKEIKSSASSVSSDSSESSVRDLLPARLQGKIFPVGRLDKDSSGLLIFTNDGVLAYRLTHPSFAHEKEYEVVLDRTMDKLALEKLEKGFMLDGSMTKPLKVWKTDPKTIRIVLTEGRNRQIRRMCQNIGYTVKSLKRVRIMNVEDNTLKPGATRALTEAEKAKLLHVAGIKKE